MQQRAEGKTFDPLTTWLGINTASLTCFISTKAAWKECWLEKFKAAHANDQLQSEYTGLRNGASSNSPGQERALETENRIFHFAPRPSLLDQLSRGGSQTCPFGSAGCRDPNPGWPLDRSLPKCKDMPWTEFVQKANFLWYLQTTPEKTWVSGWALAEVCYLPNS